MALGIIKTLDPTTGSGLITPSEGGEELRFRGSSVRGGSERSVKEGDNVEYTFHEGPKGAHAGDVRILATAGDCCRVPSSSPDLLAAETDNSRLPPKKKSDGCCG